jgi:hypothetical protein
MCEKLSTAHCRVPVFGKERSLGVMQVLSVSWVVHRIKLVLGPLKVACLELHDQMTASSRRHIIEIG